MGEDVNDYIIRKGNFASILKEFGTREGEYYKNSNWEIDEIDVFADVDLLGEITFIDIPGFDSGDSKDNVGLALDASSFDIIFFLSTADAYLRGHELSALCNILRRRESLDSFYLLATHTNSVGDPDEVEKIIYRGCERIVATMSESEKERLKIREGKGGFKKLEKRCFGFDMTSEKYCAAFNERIEKELPKIISSRLSDATKEAKEACEEYAKKYTRLQSELEKRRSAKSSESDEEQQERTRKAKEKAESYIEEARSRLKESIDEKEGYCISKMKSQYDAVMNEGFVTNAIEKKRYRNKKADIEDLSNYIAEELNDRMQKVLTDSSEDFAEEVKIELSEYQKELENSSNDLCINIDFEGFDFTRAFAAGLTGLTAYGAMAVWATVVASGSNLGAYILVAKVVSALSALGISVGGTAAAAAFVSSIGGPITIGISLALIAAIAVFGIFTGTWKKRVANKLIKTYKEKGVSEKYRDAIKEYWDETVIALDNCLDSLNEQVRRHYDGQASSNELTNEELIQVNTILAIIYGKCMEGYEEMHIALSDNEQAQAG